MIQVILNKDEYCPNEDILVTAILRNLDKDWIYVDEAWSLAPVKLTDNNVFGLINIRDSLGRSIPYEFAYELPKIPYDGFVGIASNTIRAKNVILHNGLQDYEYLYRYDFEPGNEYVVTVYYQNSSVVFPGYTEEDVKMLIESGAPFDDIWVGRISASETFTIKATGCE
jgi:hypothetical protein